ncbi:a-factor receptor [Steccherinum ochraceum]|uniref:A-factor receptor n=1 Tax=Steccherinum ochraceum TaxID=92696 RepID=A0A4R0RKW5_9APHY|nr:a-factor receptor [Steccherinum ochraceum]
MAVPYPLFPIFSFLAFLLVLIPLPWHLQAWNAGTCLFMIWAATGSLIEFVDSIVWHGSIDNVAPIWCDISTKLLIGAGVGIPAASLCINRRLYSIVSVRTAAISRQAKRNAMLIDIAIAVGFPVLVMILHVVVQGHRFNIFEDIGCVPTIYNTPPAYPLVIMWPVVLGAISFVYAALTLRAFWKRRIEFSTIITSGSSLTTSRYLRLMILSCVEMGCDLPLGAYSMYINLVGVAVAPWTSWADVHFNFGFVQTVPGVIWRSDYRNVIAMEMGRWIYPCCAIAFFLLFGFAEEARRHYASAFKWLSAKLGVTSMSIRKPQLKGFRINGSEKGILPLASEPLPPYSASSQHAMLSSASTFACKGFDFETLKSSPQSSSSVLASDSPSSGPVDPAWPSAFVRHSHPLDLGFPTSPTTSECSASSMDDSSHDLSLPPPPPVAGSRPPSPAHPPHPGH